MALALHVLALWLALPTAAGAQVDERFALALFGGVGMGGELRVDTNLSLLYPDGPLPVSPPQFTSSSLRPTPGGGVRLEFVPMRHVAVGALVALWSTQTENRVVRRLTDVDAFIAGRLPVAVFADGRTLTPYLMLPIGFSSGAGGGLLGDRLMWRGVNAGALVGAELEVQHGLAVYLEAGWHVHALRHRGGGFHVSWLAHQIVVNLGLRVAR